jgi:hypothetical protein
MAERRNLPEIRYRVNLAQECNRIANRIQKVLEDANLTLASVATDPLGASGRAMLKAAIQGEQDPDTLAEMARGLLRRKIPQLQLALDGPAWQPAVLVSVGMKDSAKYTFATLYTIHLEAVCPNRSFWHRSLLELEACHDLQLTGMKPWIQTIHLTEPARPERE